MEAVAAILAGLGISGAAGLNAWIPLLVTGLAGRWELIDLSGSYAELSSDLGLVVIAAMLIVDFVGDKVPAVDHVLHAIGTVVHPAAGAAVAAAQAGADVPDLVLLISGAVTAGGVHAGRAAVRPFGTALTMGVANPLLSLAEDGTSLLMTALALLLPLLGFAALAVLVVLMVRGLRAARSRARARPG